MVCEPPPPVKPSRIVDESRPSGEVAASPEFTTIEFE
jgi:hypothetical protein